MNTYSLSWFRNQNSGYESALAGTSQGTFFHAFWPSLLRAYYAVYPDWELRIHHDDRVTLTPYFPVLEKLQEQGELRLVYVGKANRLCEAMLWRCLPFWDPEVEVFACRDIDSLPMPRERVMLEEFCASDKPIHAMLDSESHTGPLMGGMCSFKGGPPADSFQDWIAGAQLDTHGSDQTFLNRAFPEHSQMLIHQRRELAHYSEALTLQAPPNDTPCFVNHCGAGYDQPPVHAYYPNPMLDELEKSCT